MQFDQLRRREFLSLIGGAATLSPLAARAQPRERIKRIGALMGIAENDPEARAWVSAFQRGLAELGWIEGHNVQMEFRWPAGDTAVMLVQAADLVAHQPDVILSHATPATAAIRKTTRSIPNVFVVVADPVGSGFVDSFPRPGGTSTGFTNFETTIGSKWLELLKEVSSGLVRVAMLYNPATSPGGRDAIHTRSIVAAAPSFGVSVVASPFHGTEDIDMAFAAHGRDRTAVIIIPDTSTTLHSRFIVEAAAHHHVPTIYPYRDFVNVGGLLSYGVDRADLYRHAASYVDRILRGTLPADLPVQNPTKYELAINLKTARALGLEVSPMLLGRADEVIE